MNYDGGVRMDKRIKELKKYEKTFNYIKKLPILNDEQKKNIDKVLEVINKCKEAYKKEDKEALEKYMKELEKIEKQFKK